MKTTYTKTPVSPLSRKSGMTLIEVMLSSSISLIVISATMWLMTEGLAFSWQTSNVSGNDLTHWGLTNRLVLDTRTANSVCVYSDLTTPTITTEGIDGIAHYVPERLVGNLLVLSLTLPDMDTGVTGCHKLTGYTYRPAERALYKFEYNTSAADVAAGKTVPELLIAHMGDFVHKKIAEDVALPQVGAQSAGAFFWPRVTETRRGGKATLRFQLGNTNQHRRVRDSRLVEVSFFVRP